MEWKHQQTHKHWRPAPPLLVYFSLSIKLPISQDIKFESRESQTSCNHSLQLQCISNKSPQNLPKKIQNLLKSCVFAKKEGGRKGTTCKGNLSQNQGNSRPGTETGRWLKTTRAPSRNSSPLKEREEGGQGIRLHCREKVPLFRLDPREATPPSPTLSSRWHRCPVERARFFLWLPCKINAEESCDDVPYTFGLILLETQGQLQGS